jgi:hypothetical protein
MNLPMNSLRPVFALLCALALLVIAIDAAYAEDPVFPPGIRIGIVPLAGLNPAKKFTGFESEDENVKVLMAELPAEAYSELMNALKTNPALAVKPEAIETAAGMAYYTAETAKAGGNVVRRYSMIMSPHRSPRMPARSTATRRYGGCLPPQPCARRFLHRSCSG